MIRAHAKVVKNSNSAVANNKCRANKTADSEGVGCFFK